jgi:hypothetical protein
MARSLGEPYVARDRRLEDLRPKETAKVGRDLFRKCSAVVVHRQKDALDGEGWIDRASEPGQGIEELRDALESQEFALNRDEDRIAGGERVDGKNIEGRRAIDQNEVVFFAKRLDRLLEPVLAIVHGNQLDGRADEVLV